MKLLRQRPRLCFSSAAATILCTAAMTTGADESFAKEQAHVWPAPKGDFSLLTYNVKGLPAPLALGRAEMLDRIGRRLAKMREGGRQPSVVVLQEAFTPEARRIADIAGYPFIVYGPDAGADSAPEAADRANGIKRSWYLGETQGAQIDSGLMLLSDFPILEVYRAPFPDGACAGFDCLAAKGVLMVILDVPGKGRVAVATTHLNSKGASRAPESETQAAYKAQASFLARFVARHWKRDVPLVIAGDFNRGQRPYRMRVLPSALQLISGDAPVEEALEASEAKLLVHEQDKADVSWVRKRARDMQFVFPAEDGTLEAMGASVPFGTEADGQSLSDHFGFIIDYKVVS